MALLYWHACGKVATFHPQPPKVVLPSLKVLWVETVPGSSQNVYGLGIKSWVKKSQEEWMDRVELRKHTSILICLLAYISEIQMWFWSQINLGQVTLIWMSWTIPPGRRYWKINPNLWLVSQQALYFTVSGSQKYSHLITQKAEQSVRGKLVYFCSRVSLCIPKQNEGEERKCGKDNSFQISIAAFAWTTSHDLVAGIQFPMHRAITQAFPTAKALGNVVKKQHSI